jgi:hypothetical protein
MSLILSGVIAEFLDERFPEHLLLPRDRHTRAAAAPDPPHRRAAAEGRVT